MHPSIFSRFLPQIALAALLLSACGAERPTPNLGKIYNRAAQNIGFERNPVIVIPGVLGTKLETKGDGKVIKVWGAFVRGAADADYPDGARTVALPMDEGTPLDELKDNVYPAAVLDSLEVDLVLVARLQLSAYVDILTSLAVGDYTDSSFGESGAIDYGDAHYTCFQLPYDWRRDISEESARLHTMVLHARETAAAAEGIAPANALTLGPRVDVVAHSMGGLLLRYYLRYGPQPLPADGSLPELTWEGARHVEQAIMIGTPSGGSWEVLERLLEGLSARPIGPDYSEMILGTFPALYQLLPRTRSGWLREQGTGEPIDIFDPTVWKKYDWGLGGTDDGRTLRWLLPEVESSLDRLDVAYEHLEKCLARAEQFHRALDLPAKPPSSTRLSIFVGDALETPAVIEVDAEGEIKTVEWAPGDGIVLRTNALMDERYGDAFKPRLQSPIAWDRVQFLGEEHLELTRVPEFTDNLMWMLLEAPR